MTRFDSIDLSKLPPPEVVEVIDFEEYKKAYIQDFIARSEEAGFEYNVDWAEGQTGFIESDPIVKVLEGMAYREMTVRQRVNDAARQVMLAFARGNNLEQLASFYKVKRQSEIEIDSQGRETTVWETDDRFLKRVQLAPEAFSTAGSEGAYKFFAYGADIHIKDVEVVTPEEGGGQVHVLPLMDSGTGLPSSNVIAKVKEALTPQERRPLTDIVNVRSPSNWNYEVKLTLVIKHGPDADTIISAAESSIVKYTTERHSIGGQVFVAGLIAAAKVPGVDNVIVINPLSDIISSNDSAPYCTKISIDVEVIG